MEKEGVIAMVKGVCAVVSGALVALAASFAIGGRPLDVRSSAGAVNEASTPGEDRKAMSLRSLFPAPLMSRSLMASEQWNQTTAMGSETECASIWENGDVDGVSGLASQLGLAETADDFFLKSGASYQIDRVELVMAVIVSGTVDATLNLFEDCNGKPGLLLATYPATDVVDVGTNPSFPGLTFYKFTFDDLGIFQDGGVRLWLSPQGGPSGAYFWLTSGSGLVQGSQGQYRSAPYEYPDWTAGDALCPTCFGECTDFNFRVCGKVCWLMHDSGDFSLSGFESKGFPGFPIYLSNSFDNFQIPPGESFEICRLEFWMALNCHPNRVYVEFFDNACDEPSGPPIKLDKNSPGWVPPEMVLEGGQPVLVEGLPVYKFVFECPGIELREGRNYWMTAALHWLGSPFEKALWLFGPLGDCENGNDQAALGGGAEYQILITEGRYRSDFFGFPYFAPISEVLEDDNDDVAADFDSSSNKRDFAFRLWTSVVKNQSED